MTTLRRNTKIYLNLLHNGYDWHERFIAMWKVPDEGTWALSLHREAMTLPEYWAAKIQPGVEAMEAKWKANHWKRRRVDNSTSSAPTGNTSSPSTEQPQRYRDSGSDSNSSDTERPKPNDTPRAPDSASQRVQRFDVSDLQQELLDVANTLGDVDASNTLTPTAETPAEQDTPETALAGGKSTEGDNSGTQVHKPPRHVRRRTSLEQAEADRAEVEKAWLPAVEILIQLADCLLVSSLRPGRNLRLTIVFQGFPRAAVIFGGLSTRVFLRLLQALQAEIIGRDRRTTRLARPCTNICHRAPQWLSRRKSCRRSQRRFRWRPRHRFWSRSRRLCAGRVIDG